MCGAPDQAVALPPGTWTLRALHRSGNGEARVTADAPGLHETVVKVA
jgi:hypothetical protein